MVELIIQHLSWPTAIGLVWTSLTIRLLIQGQKGLLANRWTCLATATALAIALSFVMTNIATIENQAGGLTVLDKRISYNAQDIQTFAQGLINHQGSTSHYATFQLGYDTWAPPAFACFIASIACTTLANRWWIIARTLISGYLIAVVLANALMPIIMLSYPNIETGLVGALLHVVPWLDFIKYSLHGLAWVVVVVGWIVGWWRRLQKSLPTAPTDK